jgi:hypothetical protein
MRQTLSSFDDMNIMGHDSIKDQDHPSVHKGENTQLGFCGETIRIEFSYAFGSLSVSDFQ